MTLLDVKLLTMHQNKNLDYIHTLFSEKIKLLTSFFSMPFSFQFQVSNTTPLSTPVITTTQESRGNI